MTDTAYPRHVLAWYGSGSSTLWQHEDGRLTVMSGHGDHDLRNSGWVVDTRVDLPQEPPEPEPEPGWYLARPHPHHPRLSVMRRGTNGRWYHPEGDSSAYDWQIVAPLTPEQVAAIEAKS